MDADKQPQEDKHRCSGDDLPDSAYGPAVSACYEDTSSRLWVVSGWVILEASKVMGAEYASQVNYCPVCGYKAPQQVTI